MAFTFIWEAFISTYPSPAVYWPEQRSSWISLSLVSVNASHPQFTLEQEVATHARAEAPP